MNEQIEQRFHDHTVQNGRRSAQLGFEDRMGAIAGASMDGIRRAHVL